MSSAQPFSGRPQDLPVKADLARLRVEYGKAERLAYLGHLDLIATVERCIRRARLPFSIGNGYARRVRIQFSSALPVGASSSCEYFDVRLTERVDAREALRSLRAATPEALAPLRAEYVPGRLPALEAWLDRSSWELACPRLAVGAEDLEEGVRRVRAAGELTYLRGEREKRVDLASTLVGFEAREEGGVVRARVETRVGATASLRPQVLLDAALSALGVPPATGVRVRRTAQLHEESGRLVEPFGPFGNEGPAPLS